MIARKEKDRRLVVVTPLKHPEETFPEILAGSRLVEDVARAHNGVGALAPRDVEDPVHDLHAGARQLLLRLLGERRKAPAEMPVGGVHELQHDVPGPGTWIWKNSWNSGVTTGVW